MTSSSKSLPSAAPPRRLTWLIDGPEWSASATELRSFLAGLDKYPQDDPGVIYPRLEARMLSAIADGRESYEDATRKTTQALLAIDDGRMTYQQALDLFPPGPAISPT